jgi:hypothetical protein
MNLLTDHILEAFSRGAYQQVLHEIGVPQLPSYVGDQNVEMPDEATQEAEALTFALAAVCEHRLGQDSALKSKLDIIWESQTQSGQHIIDFAEAMWLPWHLYDDSPMHPSAEALRLIGRSDAGMALIFEGALNHLLLGNLNHVLELAEYLPDALADAIQKLYQSVSNPRTLKEIHDAGLTQADTSFPFEHPMVKKIVAFSARRILKVSVLTCEMSELGMQVANTSGFKTCHLVFTLAMLSEGNSYSKFDIQEAVFPDKRPGMAAQIILAIRKMFGQDAIITHQGCYRLSEILSVGTDMQDLELLAERSPLVVLDSLEKHTANLERSLLTFLESRINALVRKSIYLLSKKNILEGTELVGKLSERFLSLVDDASELRHKSAGIYLAKQMLQTSNTTHKAEIDTST